jgi:hypothetical protein
MKDVTGMIEFNHECIVGPFYNHELPAEVSSSEELSLCTHFVKVKIQHFR